MKKIYLLLSRTGTIPSRMIHTALGGRFTHVSISVKPSTDKFYSFARKKLNNPLVAGFVTENTRTQVFSRYPDCNCAVYALEVSDEKYEKIVKILNHFENNGEQFGYNFLGLLPARLGIDLPRKYHFTCSQFVATVLHCAEAAVLPKSPSLMMPNDFPKISGVALVYSGKIGDCKIPMVYKSRITV